MTDNMTYETYKEVPHQHRYDTVVEWDIQPRWNEYINPDKPNILEIKHHNEVRRATRVMCSDCLDVKELN